MDENNKPETDDIDEVPQHLKHWPGLYVREGERIVEAPAEDQAVAQSYPTWPDKGLLLKGERLTILTRRNTYQVNERVRVIHVHEVVDPGQQVYVMGPKPVYGEYVDGQLATLAPPPGENPLSSPIYNGRVLRSPAVDYNFEITTYNFTKPGTHQLQWRLEPLQSNVITLEITDNVSS